MKKLRKTTDKMKIMDNVQLKIDNVVVEASGLMGKITKELKSKSISMKIEGNEVIFSAKRISQKEKKMIGTFKAHIRNMMIGVLKGYEYRLKSCAAHFPMNLSIQNNKFIIKNFLGESVPRSVEIKKGAEVKIEGEIITVRGIDLDVVSQAAADIEQIAKVRNKDRTRFQDGIYITHKDNVAI